MRWVGSMVADVYRILIRGGVYLYPEDSREGYERAGCACSTRPIPSPF